jgi:hypothetical protein
MLPPKGEQVVAMLANHAQRPPCFAQLHAALIAHGHRIRKHDHELTAIAENVYVGPVAALVAGVDQIAKPTMTTFGTTRLYLI